MTQRKTVSIFWVIIIGAHYVPPKVTSSVLRDVVLSQGQRLSIEPAPSKDYQEVIELVTEESALTGFRQGNHDNVTIIVGYIEMANRDDIKIISTCAGSLIVRYVT